ncbi:MAG: hypothetical protein SOW78_03155, partial [Clostridia bacterium]|nr:hypothetical protein [Clostridia bacterium]
MVYHLKAEIGTKELGKFTESDFIFSEVYSNRKKAESAGRKFLKIKLKDIYARYYKDDFDSFKDFYEYCTRNVGKYSFDDYVYGGFTITEFDPLFRENYDKYDEEYRACHPFENGITKIYAYMKEAKYEYNILGNVTACWVYP